MKDLVEVIRCKNCKYYEDRGRGLNDGYCYYWDYEEGESPNIVNAEEFCSNGEIEVIKNGNKNIVRKGD